jgi:hypothetical protein
MNDVFTMQELEPRRHTMHLWRTSITVSAIAILRIYELIPVRLWMVANIGSNVSKFAERGDQRGDRCIDFVQTEERKNIRVFNLLPEIFLAIQPLTKGNVKLILNSDHNKHCLTLRTTSS